MVVGSPGARAGAAVRAGGWGVARTEAEGARAGAEGARAGAGAGLCRGGKQGHRCLCDKGLHTSGAGHDFPGLLSSVLGVEGRESANRTSTGCEDWTPLLVSSG